MKIQTTAEQMQIKTGGITQLILGVIFGLVGIGITALPFLGVESTDGKKMPIWLGLIGLVLLAIGVYLLLSAKNKTITLVKNGQSSITARKLLGGGTETQNFQTSAIVAVNLSTRTEYVNTGTAGANNRSTPQRRSDLHLILNDNSTIEITSSSQSGLSFNGMNVTSLIRKAPLSKEAEQIAGFLGVEVKYEDSSSIQGLKNLITGQKQNPPQTNTPINPEAPPAQQASPPAGVPTWPPQAPAGGETPPPQDKKQQP